jgi:hypothetical protein
MMSLTNSPSLHEYKDGIPEKPRNPRSPKKTFRIVLLFLLVIALGLLFAQFFQNDVAVLVAGKGTVTGRVIDENGKALSAQVFIFGVDRAVNTDANGNFTYKNIPTGNRSLIIAYNGTAQEFIVQVQTGITVDLGDLPFLVATPSARP